MTSNQVPFKRKSDEITNFLYDCHRNGKERAFMDVDVICSDGRIFMHSLVLMSVSRMLRDHIIAQNPNEYDHIVIHFPDYEVSTVTHAMTLLYTGHCVVPQQELTKVYDIFQKLGASKDSIKQQVATSEDLAFKSYIRQYVSADSADEDSDEECTDSINLHQDPIQTNSKSCNSQNNDVVSTVIPNLDVLVTVNNEEASNIQQVTEVNSNHDGKTMEDISNNGIDKVRENQQEVRSKLPNNDNNENQIMEIEILNTLTLPLADETAVPKTSLPQPVPSEESDISLKRKNVSSLSRKKRRRVSGTSGSQSVSNETEINRVTVSQPPENNQISTTTHSHQIEPQEEIERLRGTNQMSENVDNNLSAGSESLNRTTETNLIQERETAPAKIQRKSARLSKKGRKSTTSDKPVDQIVNQGTNVDTNDNRPGTSTSQVSESSKVPCPICQQSFECSSLSWHVSFSNCGKSLEDKCLLSKKDCHTCRRRFSRLQLHEFIIHVLNCKPESIEEQQEQPADHSIIEDNLTNSKQAENTSNEMKNQKVQPSDLNSNSGSTTEEDSDCDSNDIDGTEVITLKHLRICLQKLPVLEFKKYYEKYKNSLQLKQALEHVQQQEQAAAASSSISSEQDNPSNVQEDQTESDNNLLTTISFDVANSTAAAIKSPEKTTRKTTQSQNSNSNQNLDEIPNQTPQIPTVSTTPPPTKSTETPSPLLNPISVPSDPVTANAHPPSSKPTTTAPISSNSTSMISNCGVPLASAPLTVNQQLTQPISNSNLPPTITTPAINVGGLPIQNQINNRRIIQQIKNFVKANLPSTVSKTIATADKQVSPLVPPPPYVSIHESNMSGNSIVPLPSPSLVSNEAPTININRVAPSTSTSVNPQLTTRAALRNAQSSSTLVRASTPTTVVPVQMSVPVSIQSQTQRSASPRQYQNQNLPGKTTINLNVDQGRPVNVLTPTSIPYITVEGVTYRICRREELRPASNGQAGQPSGSRRMDTSAPTVVHPVTTTQMPGQSGQSIEMGRSVQNNVEPIQETIERNKHGVIVCKKCDQKFSNDLTYRDHFCLGD